jgi:hypothetical protein
VSKQEIASETAFTISICYSNETMRVVKYTRCIKRKLLSYGLQIFTYTELVDETLTLQRLLHVEIIYIYIYIYIYVYMYDKCRNYIIQHTKTQERRNNRESKMTCNFDV